MALTSAQCEFFKLFGYLYLPNLLTEDIDWMTEEHGAGFEQKGMVHDGTKRSQKVTERPLKGHASNRFTRANVSSGIGHRTQNISLKSMN